MAYLKLAARFGPALLCLLLGALLWVSYGTSSALRVELKTQTERADFAAATLTNYTSALSARDAVIKEQSASIDALKATADADRLAYDQRMATARTEAAKQQDRAAELLSLAAPEGELAQCRAARDLLEGELVK